MKINFWWDNLEKDRKIRIPSKVDAFAYITRDGYISFQLKLEKNIEKKTYDNLRFQNIEIISCGKELYFVLKTSEFKDVFYYLCLDLLKNLEGQPFNKYTNIIYKVFDYWKKLFKKKQNNISEIIQMGLFAELNFLCNDKLKNLSLSENISSWRGFSGDIQDFLYENTSVEVKSKLSSKANEVTISSVNQLEHIKENLFLVCYSLDKNENGKTIETLVEEILSLIRKESLGLETAFIKGLLEYGYNCFDDYDNLVSYLVDGIETFEVLEGFPRITNKDIPTGVVKVEYKINLNVLIPYEECKLKGVKEI
ncbi:MULTISPECIES: PD-(D/E)XK motif protein [Psychrilyobacter]|uniref:PD-(D/E)XK motif protein n=1 Tax=Psychrilyobacter piezotolerans TaxID=2293438 RepID=A0ABX9KIW7_9FUSO|nr:MULTISPECIES: PD-(D/E)XK motif protein [Psychrilyobacter]MCS5420301.1 PD-(D/E)XK motif protein [Psychrilyobacter sp. S5]NDI77327.1 PD-(D/E)XK motif protein [Psychrilyobacter piezotolerans]RDE63376.1 PD-(D/E)XK motif protein [Psychrilyobacter sp. S5]REI41918.1 PD-(D/E)XK motif protein [Psychrilyobacter piezotolerans]